MTAPAPQDLGSAALVQLVAAREITARVRDRNFIISSVVIVLVLVGLLAFQVAVNSGGNESRVGIVGDAADQFGPAVRAQGEAVGVAVEIVVYADDAAARTAVEDERVDGALLDATGLNPELLVLSRDPTVEALVSSAVSGVAISDRLLEAGVDPQDLPEVTVTPLDGAEDGQRVIVAIIGTAVLYSLLILFGQFVAQGVVEEKASRVVELLLATMKPWQLLAGKIIGLGVLGFAQILFIAVVGVAGALAFDIVDIPGDLVSTAVSVVLWFVLAYALYAAVFAVAGSLVSRQEDLGTVLMPTTLVLVAAFVVGIQAAANPDGPLAVITSFVPGLSPLVMPVRQAAGEVALWEIGLSAAFAILAVALVVRVGGRVYAASLLRTSGKTKLREALRAERA